MRGLGWFEHVFYVTVGSSLEEKAAGSRYLADSCY